MTGLEFLNATPPRRVDPARADIACLVGFVARRSVRPLSRDEDHDHARLNALEVRVPAWLFHWWRERGWLPPADHCTRQAYERLVTLHDLPVPIESWEAFDGLFHWDARRLDASSRRADTYLGGAVRSFFRSGGRSCFVVRVDDPLPVAALARERDQLPARLLQGVASSPTRQESWRGPGHLLGLPEVSFLCLPDLPDLFAADPPPIPPPLIPDGEERFIECTERRAPEIVDPLRSVAPPRSEQAGFDRWVHAVTSLARFLEQHARETVLLAALPLRADESSVQPAEDASRLPYPERQRKTRDRLKAAEDAQWKAAEQIQSAFVQLTYPWLRTRDSGTLPGDLEPPDGALAGLLANLAVTRGAWRTAAREPVAGLYSVAPILSRQDLERPLPFARTDDTRITAPVQARLTIFGPTSAGLRLLTDVTTDDDLLWRPGSTVRLMNLVVRAARLAGEAHVFFNNGEELWGKLRRAVGGVLSALWAEGALQGASPDDAFEVRCDRSTMTQADLDAGRAIVRVAFTVAAPITRIVVSLSMNDSGQLSLVSPDATEAGGIYA